MFELEIKDINAITWHIHCYFFLTCYSTKFIALYWISRRLPQSVCVHSFLFGEREKSDIKWKRKLFVVLLLFSLFFSLSLHLSVYLDLFFSLFRLDASLSFLLTCPTIVRIRFGSPLFQCFCFSSSSYFCFVGSLYICSFMIFVVSVWVLDYSVLYGSLFDM